MPKAHITAFDLDYSNPGSVEPFQDILVVKNEAPQGSAPISWSADGRMIRMEPGQVGRMYRWQYMLGLHQRNAHDTETGAPLLVELNDEEGTIAYQEAQAAFAEAEVKRIADELENQKKVLADARKKANAARGRVDGGKKDSLV